MRYNKKTLTADIKRWEKMANEFMSLHDAAGFFECDEMADKLRKQLGNTPDQYCPPYMIAHCIKRGLNPERFAAIWAGEK
jgi:hypothetical protein